MRWRNRASLNKQRGGIVSSWRREGMLILAIVAVFLVGITVGGLAFGRKSEPPLRTAFNDGTAELSFFLNGVPASRQSPPEHPTIGSATLNNTQEVLGLGGTHHSKSP